MKPHKKAYLIDTNMILRYLLNDHDEFSAKAKSFMKDVARGDKKAEILEVVICECIYVLEKFYNIPKREIVDSLSKLINFSGIINPNKDTILKALTKYEETKVDIVDCLLAAHSSVSRVVISFDKDLQKLNAIYELL